VAGRVGPDWTGSRKHPSEAGAGSTAGHAFAAGSRASIGTGEVGAIRTTRRRRTAVERSIAWLIGPKGRCRKLRYHGVAANHGWLHTRLAALNLRRLVNLGLTNTAAGWAIA
jgi:hypothetical protein